MQVGGAQLTLMVHNIAVYHWNGAQRMSYKPNKHTNGHYQIYYLPAMLSIITWKAFMSSSFGSSSYDFVEEAWDAFISGEDNGDLLSSWKCWVFSKYHIVCRPLHSLHMPVNTMNINIPILAVLSGTFACKS